MTFKTLTDAVNSDYYNMRRDNDTARAESMTRLISIWKEWTWHWRGVSDLKSECNLDARDEGGLKIILQRETISGKIGQENRADAIGGGGAAGTQTVVWMNVGREGWTSGGEDCVD